MSKLDLGCVGVALEVSPAYLDEAAELERLAYSTIWLPGGQIDDRGQLAQIVAATTAVRVASAVISLDVYAPDLVTDLHARLHASAPGRFVVGLGGPQQPRPLHALNDYLDYLDQAERPVPVRQRMLAAMGPRKLELARDRSAGAIMLLVAPAYIRAARQILGGQSCLVIDQIVVPDTDPARARETARRPLRFLSGMRGYRAIFARMGFTDADIADLSDTLVDQLVIWGDAETITARIGEHLQAGTQGGPRTSARASMRLAADGLSRLGDSMCR